MLRDLDGGPPLFSGDLHGHHNRKVGRPDTRPSRRRTGGFYGEMSPNFDRLVKAAAEKGAELHANKYGLEATGGGDIRSVLANKILWYP